MKRIYKFSLLSKARATVKISLAIIILCGLNASQSWGQTTLFSDNFATSTGSTYDTDGSIGSSTNWSLTRSGNDWGAKIDGGRLDFSNDASATGNVNGWIFGYRDINALAGWNTTLSSNTGAVTWEFNMRQIRTDPAGFGSGSYGAAFVLASTSTTAATSGSGYAVVLGQSGSTDPVRLVSFNNGLQGTLTNIITSNSSGLTDFGNQYLSVRVTYNPTGNSWQLFLRNDGGSAFADPSSGTLVLQGTGSNSTYTGTVGMRYIGGYWQGSTTANQTAFFDNVYLKLTALLCGTNYSENFSSIGPNGTAPPAGWSQYGNLGGNNSSWTTTIPASGSPSAASGTLNNTLIVSTGSGVSDEFQGYNFGASGNADRALGTSPASDAGNTLDLSLINATGTSLSAFTLSYDVRRFTAASSINELPGYWVFVSSDNGSTWTEVTALRPTISTVPNTVGVSNFATTSITLPSSVANGSPIRVRWVDDNADQTSPDQIIGLDNVVIGAIPEANAGAALSAICQGGTSAPLDGSVSLPATGGTWSTSAGGTFSPSATDLNATWTPPAGYNGTATLTLTTSGGSCGTATNSKNIVVNPTNTAAAASSTPTLCINTVLTEITHATTGATGIGSVTGLPAGVSVAFASNTITISGTPSASSTFNYTIPLTGGCGSVNATGTITVAALPNAGTISGTQDVCVGGTTTFTSNGNSGGTWSSSNTAVATVNASSGLINGVANGTATITYTVSGTGGCPNATATRSVNVTSPAAPTGTGASRCGTGTTNLNAAAVAGTTIDWYAAATGGSPLIGGTGTTTFTTPSISTTTTFYAAARNTTTGCSSATRTAVVATVKPVPTDVTASVSPTSVCAGESVVLNASATSNSATPYIMLSESFNAVNPAWTTVNNSTGGTPSSAAWTIRANNYNNGEETIVTDDASSFMFSDSDAQGDGSSTNTSLVSPAFSTVGVAGANINLNHYFRDAGPDQAFVEASTDGSTWETLQTYTSTQGTRNNFANPSIALTSNFLNQAVVYIRFRYVADWGWYWAINSMTVTASSTAAAFTWSSTPAGFTSSVEDPTGVIPTQTTSYTVTVTNNYGCSTSATTADVSVTAAPSAPTSAGNSRCGAGTVVLSATATAGNTIDWYAAATGGSVLSGGSSTSTYTTPSITTTTTYYAEARNTSSGCNSATRTAVVATINSSPAINNMTANACTGVPFLANPVNGTNGTVPAGTTYTWSTPTGSGYSGGSAQSSNQTNVSQTLTLTGAGPATAVYTITPKKDNCTGSSYTLTLTLNALPQVTITPNYCVGGGNVQLTATAGLTYLWSNGATTQSVNVQQAGVYNVTGTNSATGCSSTATQGVATELVTNGDFENQNTGFSSGYTFVANVAGNNELIPEATYGIAKNANTMHPSFYGTGHTTTNGNDYFMIVNGSPTLTTIWTQPNIAVQPNTTYYFSAWGLSVVNSNNAALQFSINGTQVGSIAYLPNGYANTAGPYAWTRFYGQWESGSTTVVNLSIINLQTAFSGNDFGLDDISFGTLSPITLSASPSANGNSSVCEGTPFFLNANALGGASPYTYSWSGPNGFTSTQENPQVTDNATAAINGTYSVQITDALGCVGTNTVSVTVSGLPNNISLTAASASVCLDGSTQIQLSSTETTVGYSLYNASTNQPVGTTSPGNGGNLNLSTGLLTSSTTFYVIAERYATGCERVISPNITVAVSTTPVLVTNNIAICSGTADLTAAAVTTGSTGGGTLTYWSNAEATTALVNPNAVGSGTYYIKSSVGSCLDIEPVTVVVSGTPVSTFDFIGSPFCSNLADPSPVYSGGGTAGVFSSSAGLVFVSTSTGVIDLSASTPGTYSITNTINPVGGCTPSATSRTITITGAPDPTFAYATNNFCQSVGGNNPVPIFQGGAQAGTFSTSAVTGLAFVSTATGEVNLAQCTPGSYAIINTIAAAGGCPAIADTLFVEINPYSFDGAISISSTVDQLCAGNSVNFSASGTSYLTVLERETFNGTFSAWTTTNSSTGGTPANASWTLRPDNYNYSSNFSSNDDSQFYLTNSQAQGGGGSTSTVLKSPALNTVGFTTLSLDFHHFYDFRNSGDNCKVQVSTNNSTWTDLATYTADQGGFSNFVNAVVNMNAYVGLPSVWVRFLYTASNDRYWAIDNVTLSGNSTRYFYNWSSTPASFTSTEQNPQNYVPTVSAYYGVQVANNYGCVVTTSPVPVTVNPLPADNAGADQQVCYNTQVTLGNPGIGGRSYSWSPAAGLSASTIARPTVTLANSASYTLTETINSTGCSDTNMVFISVLPYSQINAMTTTTCSGNAFTVSPANGVNGNVLAGTTYIWSAPTGTGFTGGSSQSTAQNQVSQVLSTTLSSTQTATYQVTPTLNNCSGPAFDVQVALVPQPNAGNISGAQPICLGTNAPQLSVVGGVGSLQWQSSTDNLSYNNISGANAANYSPGVLTQTTYYRVVAANSPCASTTGNEVALTTLNLPTVQVLGSSAVCNGAQALVTLNLNGTGPWSGTLSDGQEFSALNSQLSLPVTPSGTTVYTVVQLSDANCNDNGNLSSSATISVQPTPVANISGGGEICGGTSTQIFFNGTPNATVSYTVNGGGTQQAILNGTGNATLNTENLFQPTTYGLTGVVSGSCSAAANGSTTVTLGETPDATMVLSDTNAVCVGTTLNVLFSGTPNATVTYQVNGGANQTVVLNASGNASLSTGDINANTTHLLVSASNGNCTRTIDLTRNIIVTQNTYYLDSDGDGFGVTANSIIACTLPAGYAAVGGDCCDSNPNLNPLTEWWADVDGDGYGSVAYNLGCVNGTVTCSNTSWPNQPQLIPYYAAANNGNSYVLDCNDNDGNVRPNALEICGNTLDDDCDGLIDEGCSTMPNDNFNFATSISLNNSSMWYPQCNTINGTLVATAPSPQGNSAYVLPGGGRDVWYKFIAPSTAVRIQVIPNGFDALIELKNGTGTTELSAENVNPAVGGTEILNYSGLVPGQLYTFGVRSVSQLEGTFALCISSLMPSGCASTQPLNGWNLCDLFKAKFTGANSYVFNFTGVGGTLSAPFTNSSVTVSGSTRVALSTAQLGLIYGGVYDVRIDAVYNLTDGMGVAEAPITVLGSVSGSCDNLTIMSQPTQVVLNTQVCPVTLIRNSYLYSASPSGGARVCTALNFTFEFTKVTDCTGLTILSQPILATGLGNPPQIYLGSVFATNAIANGYWRVRIRPNFQGGPGQFGDARVILINSTSGMNMDSGEDLLRISGEEYGMSVVPNPSLALEDFELRFNEPLSLGANINIYDATGRWICSNYYTTNGTNRILIDNMNHLGAGMYMLEICVDGEVIIAERIVRN